MSSEDVSDGYHTFGELYDHRRALTAALASALPRSMTWRSKAHHPEDDPIFEGYFIVGIEMLSEQVTYHYDLKYWDNFTYIREVDHAPKWNGHTPDDVVNLLLEWARS